MSMIRNILPAFLLILFPASAYAAATMLVDEDFDDGTYTNTFVANFCEYAWSCRVVDSPGRLPGKAARLEFRDGTCNTGTRSTMSADLRDGSYMNAYNDHIWMGFRIYINENTYGPENVTSGTYTYHDTPDSGESWRVGTFELYTRNGKAYLHASACLDEIQADGQCYGGPYDGWDYKSGDPEVFTYDQNAWNVIVSHVKYDVVTQNGSVELWHNGVSVYTSSGHYFGFNDDVGPFLKLAVYYWACDATTDERILYYDDVKQCEGADCTYSDVMPTGATLPAGEE